MKRTVGIDIGNHSVKLIELQDYKGQTDVVNCTKNLVVQNNIRASIKELLSIVRLSVRRVNISLSGQSVIVRYIEMPVMNKEEIKSAIKFEAEKYIPFDVNDAIIDCCILGRSLSGSTQKVLLVAAKKARIDSYLELFKELGLEINTIDIDSFAFLNAFERVGLEKKDDSTYAIINLGARLSNMDIVTKKEASFTRDILWGGMSLTDRIKDIMAISAEDAEKIKHKPGGKKDEVYGIISPVIEKLISEIRLSFDYFETQFGKAVERLYISGGTSYLFNIQNVLRDSLNIDIRTWNPFEGINTKEAVFFNEEARNLPSQFAVAVGLALRK